MRILGSAALSLGLASLAVALSSCGGHCLEPPCPPPIAITVSVTSTAGVPPLGAVASITGAATETTPCSSTCYVVGGAGTYIVEVSAPGFQTARRTVIVAGNNPKDCECATAVAQHLDLALVRNP
jgi:hypothetical protein